MFTEIRPFYLYVCKIIFSIEKKCFYLVYLRTTKLIALDEWTGVSKLSFFLLFNKKHMLRVLIRSASLRHF